MVGFVLTGISHASPRGDWQLTGLEQADAKRLLEKPILKKFALNHDFDRIERDVDSTTSAPKPILRSSSFAKMKDSRTESVPGASPTLPGALHFLSLRSTTQESNARKEPLPSHALVEESRAVKQLPGLGSIALSACKDVLKIHEIAEPEKRAEFYDAIFDKFQAAVAPLSSSGSPLSVYAKGQKHSELDLIVAQRALPEQQRASRWKQMSGLLSRFKFDESSREGRQQLASLIVAGAYIRHESIADNIRALFQKMSSDMSLPYNRSAMSEVVKKVALIQNEQERGEVIAQLLRYLGPLDYARRSAFTYRLSHSIDAMERLRDRDTLCTLAGQTFNYEFLQHLSKRLGPTQA